MEANTDACLEADCLNGGTCLSDENSIEAYVCLCPHGYEGEKCESKGTRQKTYTRFGDYILMIFSN